MWAKLAMGLETLDLSVQGFVTPLAPLSLRREILKNPAYCDERGMAGDGVTASYGGCIHF